MIVNGKKYDNLKDSLEDVKIIYPFMTLERLKNIQAKRTDRLSNCITIEKIEKDKMNMSKLLKLLKEEDIDTFYKVKKIINENK